MRHVFGSRCPTSNSCLEGAYFVLVWRAGGGGPGTPIPLDPLELFTSIMRGGDFSADTVNHRSAHADAFFPRALRFYCFTKQFNAILNSCVLINIPLCRIKMTVTRQ